MVFRTDKSAPRTFRIPAVVLAVVFLLLSVLLLHAGNPWESKPVDQWTFEELGEFLENSPWARNVTVTSTHHMTSDPGGYRRERRTETSYDPTTGVTTTYTTYVTVQNPPSLRPIRFNYNIVWLSSKLVQDALAMQERMGPSVLTWWWGSRDDLQVSGSQDQIVLLLVGPFLAQLERPDLGLGPTKIYLRPSGSKRKIPIQSVQYIGGLGAALLTFPRDLSGKESHVTLHCEFQRLRFKKKFDLRQMVVAGSPDF